MSSETEHSPAAPPQGDRTDVAALVRDHQKEARKLMDEQAKLAADLAAARRQIEELSAAKTRAQELEQQMATLAAERDTYAAKERTRVDALAAANVRRVEALPEQFRGIVPAGLDADATAEHIAKIEQIAKSLTPPPPPPVPPIPSPRGNQLAGDDAQNTGRHWQNPAHKASDQTLAQRGREWVMGKGN